MNRTIVLITFTISVLLGACGCQESQKTTGQTLKEKPLVKTIGLLPVERAKDYEYFDFDPVMAVGLGAIGASINMVSNANRIKLLTAALDAQEFDFAAEFTVSLKEKLSPLGFSVVDVNAVRKNPCKLLKDYEEVESNADAVFDVTGEFVGFYKRRWLGGEDYRPCLAIPVKLVDVETGEVLYSCLFKYGGEEKENKKFVRIDPDDTYVGKNFDKMMEDPENVTAGIRAGIQAITDRIAEDIQSHVKTPSEPEQAQSEPPRKDS